MFKNIFKTEVGFGVTIFIWAFVIAAIYKATNSVIACAVYYTFIDAICEVYDWNMLFDVFPGNMSTNIYRILCLFFAIILWIVIDNQEIRTRFQLKIFNKMYF